MKLAYFQLPELQHAHTHVQPLLVSFSNGEVQTQVENSLLVLLSEHPAHLEPSCMLAALSAFPSAQFPTPSLDTLLFPTLPDILEAALF